MLSLCYAAFTPAQLVARNKLRVARNMLLQATSCAQHQAPQLGCCVATYFFYLTTAYNNLSSHFTSFVCFIIVVRADFPVLFDIISRLSK